MKFLPEDGSLQLTAGWTGDVKYHLGGIKTTDSYVRISLDLYA
jgi:2-oxoglutarate dehydrogenase E1 component